MSAMAHWKKVHDELSRWLDELRQSATDVEIARIIEDRVATETDSRAINALKHALAREHIKQGNEAAADVLYRELLPEVEYWYGKLRRTNGSAHDKTAKAIEDRIQAEPDAPEIDDLFRMLAGEYSALGDYVAAETIERRLADRNPDDPLPLNRLASNKCSLQRQPEQAMELVNRALDIAHRTGEFRRYTLGNKARIALALKRYDIVEGVLKNIMQLKVDIEVPDIGRERDFFDALPPDRIDPEVARQYDQYCLAVGLRPRER